MIARPTDLMLAHLDRALDCLDRLRFADHPESIRELRGSLRFESDAFARAFRAAVLETVLVEGASDVA